MNLELTDRRLPGSVITKENAGGLDGEEFLDKVFFLTDGIMLSQIKEISGVDGTTLQNWVKRGWIGSTVNKKYSKNQLARILIINMLRDTMHLKEVDFLLRYINGTINFEEDDIIPEARLYGYICRITDSLAGRRSLGVPQLKVLIRQAVAEYSEKMPGAKERLENALAIIVTAYYASLAKEESMSLLSEIRGGAVRGRRRKKGG